MQEVTIDRNFALGPVGFAGVFKDLVEVSLYLMSSGSSMVFDSRTRGFKRSNFPGVAHLAIFLGGALSLDGVLDLEILLTDLGEAWTEETVLAIASYFLPISKSIDK